MPVHRKVFALNTNKLEILQTQSEKSNFPSLACISVCMCVIVNTRNAITLVVGICACT